MPHKFHLYLIFYNFFVGITFLQISAKYNTTDYKSKKVKYPKQKFILEKINLVLLKTQEKDFQPRRHVSFLDKPYLRSIRRLRALQVIFFHILVPKTR